MKTNKTNAARLLDRAKIPYELVPYEVDENNLAATHVAEQLGENIEQVFKTLVLRDIRLCDSGRQRGRFEKGCQNIGK